MLMREYLEQTSDAASALVSSISNMQEPISRLDLSLRHLRNLESYLKGTDPNGRGEWHLEFFRTEWEREPTLANAVEQREWVVERLLVKRQSLNILCGSILLIAQNGIKLVLGPPARWRPLRGRVLSRKGECVLDAVWHGRNQAAHVEGLIPGGESDRYFQALAMRYGATFSTATNGEFISEPVLRDILGWIGWRWNEVYYPGHNGPVPYVRDMLALAALVDR